MDDPKKFLSLMQRTLSDNDNEALIAIRKANAMLAADDMNWEEYLTALAKPTIVYRDRAPTGGDGFRSYGSGGRTQTKHGVRYDDADEIDPLFERAFKRVSRSRSFYEWIEDVHRFWESNGYLTERQYEVLKGIR